MPTKPLGYWISRPDIEEITGSHFENLTSHELAQVFAYCSDKLNQTNGIESTATLSLRPDLKQAISKLEQKHEFQLLMQAILDHL